MSDIRFARVFSNGAILQRGKEINVWGFASEGCEVTVSLAGKECRTSTENGRFDVTFPAMDKGGPYELVANDSDGGSIKSTDIMIGDVIIISGQSNMEFPMERVRETYPDEWDEPNDPLLRTFKVTENGVFGRSISDVETGMISGLP